MQLMRAEEDCLRLEVQLGELNRQVEKATAELDSATKLAAEIRLEITDNTGLTDGAAFIPSKDDRRG
jgi:hypothetical protein